VRQRIRQNESEGEHPSGARRKEEGWELSLTPQLREGISIPITERVGKEGGKSLLTYFSHTVRGRGGKEKRRARRLLDGERGGNSLRRLLHQSMTRKEN